MRQPLVYITVCHDGMGTYEQSAWVREGNGRVKQKPSSGKLKLKQFHGLGDWMSATDSLGRDYVSNVCAVLGGLGDKDIIAESIEGGKRFGSVLLLVVVDEGEALALAGELVLGEEDPGDVAEWFEQFL